VWEMTYLTLSMGNVGIDYSWIHKSAIVHRQLKQLQILQIVISNTCVLTVWMSKNYIVLIRLRQVKERWCPQDRAIISHLVIKDRELLCIRLLRLKHHHSSYSYQARWNYRSVNEKLLLLNTSNIELTLMEVISENEGKINRK